MTFNEGLLLKVKNDLNIFSKFGFRLVFDPNIVLTGDKTYLLDVYCPSIRNGMPIEHEICPVSGKANLSLVYEPNKRVKNIRLDKIYSNPSSTIVSLSSDIWPFGLDFDVQRKESLSFSTHRENVQTPHFRFNYNRSKKLFTPELNQPQF